MRTLRRACAVGLITLAVLATDGSAQADARRSLATRAELEQLARAGESSADSDIIRRRLQEGDFQPGDRIILEVMDEAALTDTFAVRQGPSLDLPNMRPVSLAGVLRSELQAKLQTEVARYIRNPQVRAEPLVRIAVSGAVNRPGFFNLPADMVASEVVMVAGGPAANADLRKSVVRRGAEPLLTREQVAAAFGRGASLDQLGMQGGDELVIGQKSGGAMGALQTVGLISGILFGVAAFASIF